MGKLNTLKTFLLLTILIAVSSCESNDEIPIDPDNLLIGNWADPVYDNETTTFQRAGSLPNEAYGVAFKADGVFIERSSGWCGTPPLIFSDFEGTWETEDTLIKITTQYYPGKFNWRIVSLTEDKLVVKRELTEQEMDHRHLMDLFNEIYNLSISVPCEDAKDWTFTAYGSKACGGPQGFIPYSNQIDVVNFLNKVDTYTAAENAYNIKWGIISTCDLPQQPTSVACQNGLPILNY